ncbi:MAG TPA: hypothetical protein PKA63_00035 [Oligoflexia bacterium]|nr:hypothetical protein [Oligoflexia bacterium]HMP47036.1 hypothetical protein [Oligoflexia bacterium]
MTKQGFFRFSPVRTNDLEFFVPHSGVAEAYGLLSKVLEDFKQNEGEFILVYISGPAGVGKSHLTLGFGQKFREIGVESIHMHLTDQVNLDKPVSASLVGEFYEQEYEQEMVIVTLNSDGTPSGVITDEAFISEYQRLKISGGIIFVHSVFPLNEKLLSNPHIFSRLRSGLYLQLSFPSEEEHYPVLRSLLERHHIRLSDSRLKKIIEHAPGTPASLEVVSFRLQEMLQQGEKFNSSLVKKVLSSPVG